MKLFFIFSIILSCLIVQNLSSSPAEPTTTPVGTTAGIDTSTDSSVITTSAGSSGPNPTNAPTEPNTGSTPEPQIFTGSTTEPPVITGPTGASSTKQPGGQTTPNSPVETTAAHNIPTTQSDTWAEFDLDCNTTADYCIYTINAPQLSADAYNAENSKYQTDKSEYLSASSKANYDSASFYASDVYQLYKDTKNKFDSLTAQMDLLSEMVNQAYDESQNQTEVVKQTLAVIKEQYSSLSNCYYRRCALATVPPSTTTTTQRTTPKNPCVPNICIPPSPYFEGNCSVLFNGNPTCQCPGNLDQNGGCKSAGCNLFKDGLKDGTLPGPFWSPGYTKADGGSYGKNLNCEYKISSTKAIKVAINSFKFDPTLTLTVNNRVVANTITDAVKLKKFLDTVIGSSKVLTVSFKTGNVPSTGGPYFIDWDLS